jgi:Tfp pilus assembly protein PilO
VSAQADTWPKALQRRVSTRRAKFPVFRRVSSTMRADLLLSQPNMGRRTRLALRVAAGVVGLYGLAVALLFWNMNTTLKREQAALKVTRQRTAEGRAASRRKREEAAQMGVVNVAPPAGSGTAEFTEELYRLASASGSGIFSVMFPTSGAVGAAPPPPPPPAGDNASGKNGGGNDSNGNVAVAPAADPNADDGWKRAPFECNLTGSFPTLQDFLERLTRLPRVVEISGIELHRDQVDARTGMMRVHLKLTGAVFGQDGKP